MCRPRCTSRLPGAFLVAPLAGSVPLRVEGTVILLDDAARAAVARWRYSPTTLNGVNVPVIMTVTVTFSLK